MGRGLNTMPTAPALFYLSPEWDKLGRLTRHSLVWNALDGLPEVDRWIEALTNRRPLAGRWHPPLVMLEQGEQDGDFLAACRETLAIKPAAWEAIKDLAGSSVEALPVAVTRRIDPAKFTFPTIPAAKRPSYLLLHGLLNVPLRHGQTGYWDVTKNRYDMSLSAFAGLPPRACKVPWLDPAEFAGKHLFLIENEWVASPEFVHRIREKRLTGLVFHPINYQPKPRPLAPRLKKTMPKPPRPDFALAERGFSPKLGKQWLANWDWLVAALKNRGWKARKARLKARLPARKLRAFENEHGIKVPRDYAQVLMTFASAATVDLGRVEPGDPPYPCWEEIGSRFRDLLFGGVTHLWSFDVPVAEYARFQKWADDLVAEETLDDEYCQHFRNKLPILRIGNGDYIALDLKTGVPTYISHEGDGEIHGKPLGKSFVDFITRWSWTCLPWPDFLPSTDFYDDQSARLPEASPILTCWHAWLRGAPLPPE
jgi:SMI1 / KNR4 family (SUKH-1)